MRLVDGFVLNYAEKYLFALFKLEELGVVLRVILKEGFVPMLGG